MSKKRASVLRQSAAKLFAEEFKKVSADVSAICGSQAGAGGSGDTLSARCDCLLAVLQAQPALAPYVAQGFLTLLPHLLAHVRTSVGESEPRTSAVGLERSQSSVLRLAHALVRSGTPREVLDTALDERAASGLAHLAHDVARDAATEWVGEAATYILLRGITVATKGDVLAQHLLQDATVVESTSELIARCAEALRQEAEEEGARIAAALVRVIRLTRAAVGVVDMTVAPLALVRVFLCDKVRSRLVAVARQSASVRDELLLLLVVLALRTSSELPRHGTRINGNVDTKQVDPDAADVRNLALMLCASVDETTTTPTLPVRLARGLVLAASDAVVASDVDDDKAESSFSSTSHDEARQLNALHTCCAELRRSQFESTTRVACLQRLQGLLFAESDATGADESAALTRVVLLGLVPEAPRTLHSCACDVDEAIGAGACALLARLFAKVNDADHRRDDDFVAVDSVCRVGGDAETWSRQLRDTLVDELLLLGCVLVVEDALVDYSTGVVSAALRLLGALLRYSSQAHHRVLASHCVARVVKTIHDIAEKEDCIVYVNDAEKAALLEALMTSLRLLTPGEARRVVPEHTLADIGTVVSRAATQETVVESSLETLVFLAAVHPLVASMTLDFEFLSEQLTSGCTAEDTKCGAEAAADEAVMVPTGANAAIVVRSFDVMTAMVRVEPRVVTFEWIETLVQAVRRLPTWNDTPLVDGFAAAVWECLLQTLRVCDDGREYVFDEDIVTHWQASLRQATHSGTPATASLVPVLIRVAAFIPHALLDGPVADVTAAVTHLTRCGERKEEEQMEHDDALVRDACTATLDFVDAICQNDPASVTSTQWDDLVHGMLAILKWCDGADAKEVDLRVTRLHMLHERALTRLCVSGVHTAPVLLNNALMAWQGVTGAATGNDDDDDVASDEDCETASTSLHVLLMSLNAVLGRCREARGSVAVRTKFVAMTCDALQKAEALPEMAALLGAARSVFDPTAVTCEVQHAAKELLLAGAADEGIVPRIACFLNRPQPTTSATEDDKSLVTTDKLLKNEVYGLLTDILLAAQLDEPSVSALTSLQTFLVEHTLGDVPQLPAACDLLLLLLNFASVRAQLRVAAPSLYAAALQHIASSADAVAAQLRVSLYQSELAD